MAPKKTTNRSEAKVSLPKRLKDRVVTTHTEAKEYAISVVNQVVEYLEEESKTRDEMILSLNKSISNYKKLIDIQELEIADIRGKLHEILSWHYKETSTIMKTMAKETQISILESQIKMAREAIEKGFINPSWDVSAWEERLLILKKPKGGPGPSNLSEGSTTK